MICSSSSPPIRRRPGEDRGPRGFTLVELLVVILILAALIALLLPALNGALRAAKNAAVGGEINQLAQALASFKAQYGDYPPSRILLVENGDYSQFMGNAPLTSQFDTTGAGDINTGQLALRSVAALRKFFPRVALNTTAGGGATGWYDFNGNGGTGPDNPYVLQGHEALVFFLGGIPQQTASGYGMTGFGKDPTNPFTNSISNDPLNPGNPSPAYSGNRQPPLFEFAANRLVVDAANPYAGIPYAGIQKYILPQIPGYLDSLGNAPPQANSNPPPPSSTPINFYAYFSAYGNGGYDPNDVNFISENYDPTSNTSPELGYNVNFPVTGATYALSPAPNPYTSTVTVPGTLTATFLNPQSFQIMSSGIDGTYGVGGLYSPNLNEALPFDSANNPYLNNTVGPGIRIVERDNVTNFHSAKLE